MAGSISRRRALTIFGATAGVAGLGGLPEVTPAARAEPVPAEPLVLAPGVTDVDVVPETWTLDLRGLTREQAIAAAAGLSSRVYGSHRGGAELFHPLTLTAHYDEDVVLGISVDAVSRDGAVLDIHLDGAFFHRLSWPRANQTHRPETIYWLAVPAGERTVSVQIADQAGVVVVADYTFARVAEDFPSDRPREELQQQPPPPGEPNTTIPGYLGIWFALDQVSEWGDKYSGGLGTYTMKHSPLAVHSAEVGTTFFVYGGTTAADERHLLIMASAYDHHHHRVPQPTVVHNKIGVDDPHDNASIALDGEGYVWVFISGRATARPGYKYRSTEPYSVAEFEQVTVEEMTYPQPRWLEGHGFVNLFTKYSGGRELYWETSADGVTWSEDHQLAGFGGHYQVSERHGERIVTAFDYHRGGNVDIRTNLYVATTDDLGQTWTTMDGRVLDLPLTERDNPALVIDYEAADRLVYVKDLNFDGDGNPAVLSVTSSHHQPGPDGDPRTWELTRWTGSDWVTSEITTSDHNYDSGSLYFDGAEWVVYAPTGTGPQPYQTGGEMAIWRSSGLGQSWTQVAQVTAGSEYNHSYARRPLEQTDPFFALWADGDPTELTESRIYFGDSSGRYWQLPTTMTEAVTSPRRQCHQPDERSTVFVGAEDSGVPNRIAWGRASINDAIEDDLDWRSREAFLWHVEDVSTRLVQAGTLSRRERLELLVAARRSRIGDRA